MVIDWCCRQAVVRLRKAIIIIEISQQILFNCTANHNAADGNWILINTVCLRHLIHWGRMTHICVGNLTIIGSDNGLSPGRRQAIIWANAGILLMGPLGTNSSDLLIEIQIFPFKKKHLKVSSAKLRPFCRGLNELTIFTAFVKRNPHAWICILFCSYYDDDSSLMLCLPWTVNTIRRPVWHPSPCSTTW